MEDFRTTVESVELQTQAFGMQSCGTAAFKFCSAVRLQVIENRVKIGSHQKKSACHPALYLHTGR